VKRRRCWESGLRFVGGDAPLFGDQAVLHPQQMRADAFLPARSQPRVPTVDCDEGVLGDHLLHFQAQRVGKIPDEVDKIVAAFKELRSTLREGPATGDQYRAAIS
jgi:hypothetical protein